MSTVRLLDAELLGRFELLLRGKGVNVDDLAPGLTDAEIDGVIEPWGLQLPEEARVWWRWHDGAPRRVYLELLPRREMLRLEEAVGLYASLVDEGTEAYADPKGVQPVDELPAIFVEGVASGDVPAAVYSVNDWAEPSRLVLPSFGELVHVWIDLIERGVYASRPEGGWHEIRDYPTDVLELGVA